MEENLILMVNHEMICRLCLHSTGAMSEIYENVEGNALKDLIFWATGLVMTQNDNLPSKICHKCRYLVELCYEVRNMAMKTHRLLSAAVNRPPQGDSPSRNDISQKETLPATSKQFAETQDLEADQKSYLSFIDKNLEDTMKDDKPDDFDDDSEKLQDLSLKEKKCSKNGFIVSRVRLAPPKQLVCQICLSSFSNIDQVQTHVETHYKESNLTPYFHLKRPFECQMCKVGVSKTQLVQHHRRHLKVNPYVCKHPGCVFVGKNRDSLRHHRVRHGAPAVVCERCGALFRRRWELAQHAARWHGSRAVARRGAPPSFQYESGVQRHLQRGGPARRVQRAAAGAAAGADADIGKQEDIELMLPQQVIKVRSEKLLGQLKGKSLLIQPVDRDLPTENSVLCDLAPDDLVEVEVEVADDETDADADPE